MAIQLVPKVDGQPVDALLETFIDQYVTGAMKDKAAERLGQLEVWALDVKEKDSNTWNQRPAPG